MDDRGFDQLARALGRASTRRGALAALAGSAAGLGVIQRPGAAKKKRKRCDPACAVGQTCRKGACTCDDGGTVCGASCCAIGKRCENGVCVPELPRCAAAGDACTDTGVPCCAGLTCASGQGGQADVACRVPAGGPCRVTADCVYGSTCMEGACVADPPATPSPAPTPAPTPNPPTPRCTPTVSLAGSARANGEALQDAVAAARSGDVIVLAPGDYQFDAPMSTSFASAGILVDRKSIAIEGCTADGAVNLICPGSAAYTSCIQANGDLGATSLSLKGVTVQFPTASTETTTGGFAYEAALTLEDVAFEVASTYGLFSFYSPASITLKAGVTLRTGNAAATALLAAANGTIACDATPAIEGYGPAKRCLAPAGGILTWEGCGCPS